MKDELVEAEARGFARGREVERAEIVALLNSLPTRNSSNIRELDGTYMLGSVFRQVAIKAIKARAIEEAN